MQTSFVLRCRRSLGAALGSVVLCTAAASVQASILTVDVSLDSGPLQGAAYSGSLAFDAPAAGFDGPVDLTAFAFDFQGQTYTLASADSTPQAWFLGGSFIGVDYTDLDGAFTVQFTAGFSDVSEAFFTYDSVSTAGNGGFGSLRFAAAPAVPEPSGLVLALSSLALLGAARRRSGR